MGSTAAYRNNTDEAHLAEVMGSPVGDALKIQALKRMESGILSDEECERLGAALMNLDMALEQIKEEQKRKKGARAPGDPWFDFRTEEYYKQCEISAAHKKAMAACRKGSYDEAQGILSDIMVKDPEHSMQYLRDKRYVERAQKRAAKAKRALK